METTEILKLAGAMSDVLTGLVRTAEKSGASGPEKRAAVLELAGSIYEGARRTGALDGVKEIRGIDWALLAPFVGLVVDGIVRMLNQLGAFVSSRKAVPR